MHILRSLRTSGQTSGQILKMLLPLGLVIILSLACNAVTDLPFIATPTPTLTATVTLTPTPTPTLTPTPTPTPRPEVRVADGDRAIFNGDWDTALSAYQSALDASIATEGGESPEIYTAALLGLGRTHYLAGNYVKAQDLLQNLIDNYPTSPHLPETYFFLAQTYSTQGKNLEAADAYLNYLALQPGIIDSYVYEFRGDSLFAAGHYLEAVTDYQSALRAGRGVNDLSLDIKIARSYVLGGEYATALVGYQDIYTRTSNDYTRAQMDLFIGQVYTLLGQNNLAYAAYLDAVINYPQAYDSYSALVSLVEAGIPVGELTRGLVDYNAGQYGVALAAFDRYLQGTAGDPATAHYYKGLTLRALGNIPEALTEWDRVIQDYPGHSDWDKAWEQKAFAQWYYQDEYTEAVQTLLGFVSTSPMHSRAAEFLFDAARIAERGNFLSQAADLWERVTVDYPDADQAYLALFLSGITHYRLGLGLNPGLEFNPKEYTRAHEIFQRAQAYAADLETRAAAYFWSGKCQQALGNTTTARSEWEQAGGLDRTGYYSERARALLNDINIFDPPQDYDFTIDITVERAEAEQWMHTVFSIPAETDLSKPGPLENDPRFQRGRELWKLGLYTEARAEFEDLRQWVQDDPANTYRLANYLVEIGLYRSGIFAARRVLSLAGMDDSEAMSAPIYFNHLRYGTYFRDLVIPAAQKYDFHPLFLFSLIRQESLFEGFVRSSMDARGLMQILPSTGQEVATNAGWPPNYSSEDLYRPLISVNLGSAYLDRQRRYLSSVSSVSPESGMNPTPMLYAALAAYNGGPGNASTWLELAPNDPDLFVEVIRYDETRLYIQRIYAAFMIYSQLYNRTP